MEKYTLVAADGPHNLIRMVNDAIKEGYKPIGGLVINDGWYIQPVFKE